MKVSIIIPTYNSRETIIRAIESCLIKDISESEIEIIVIDDGSIDDTVELIQDKYFSLIESNILRVIQGHHGGAGNARNIGLRESKGNWIAFLDSDDEFLNFNYILNLISRVDGSIQILNFFNDENIRKNKKYIFHGEHFINENLGLCNYIQWNSRPSHKLFRSSFLKKFSVTFPIDIKVGEDLVFNLACLMHNPKILSTNKLVYKINQNSESITHTILQQNIYTDAVRLLDIVLDYPLSDKTKDEFIAKNFSAMLVRYLKSQYDIGTAMTSIKKFTLRYTLNYRESFAAFIKIAKVLGWISALFSFLIWNFPELLRMFFYMVRKEKYRR